MSTSLIRFVIGVFVLSLGPRVMGCVCERIKPPCQEVWQTDVVFVGTVIGGLSWWTRLFREPNFESVSFHVEDGIRGIEKGTEVTVLTVLSWYGGGCGYPFESGESYVVYARRDNEGRLRTSLCTRTAHVSEAERDLDYFQTLRAGGLAPRIFGYITLAKEDTYRRNVTAASEPVSGVPIVAEHDGYTWTTVSGQDGSFELTNLPTGTYRLSALLTHPSEDSTERLISLPSNSCVHEIFLASARQELSVRTPAGRKP